ncbi:hypothetical protein [Salinigranum halophilum]|uniref:hypothetical protein n=1 Tax=Salinigranum halophilum TaxID=2565931 RepID=UPI0010A8F4D4|nr:hypothetical protein [Salinigranum halophilum]
MNRFLFRVVSVERRLVEEVEFDDEFGFGHHVVGDITEGIGDCIVVGSIWEENEGVDVARTTARFAMDSRPANLERLSRSKHAERHGFGSDIRTSSQTWSQHGSVKKFVCSLPMAYFRFDAYDRNTRYTRYRMDTSFRVFVQN